jgi:SET domain-containing protein
MYRPLPNFLTIKPSSIEGLGLFTLEDLKAGTDLGMTHIYDERFPDQYIRLPLGGFFNHAINPNCAIVKLHKDPQIGTITHLRLQTIVDIKAGQEVTAYYTLYQP